MAESEKSVGEREGGREKEDDLRAKIEDQVTHIVYRIDFG